MKTTTIGAISWVATVLFFVGQAIAQTGVRAPYSMIDNYVSDLGAVGCGPVAIGIYRAEACSPLHALMNAGFIVTGVGIVLGTVLVRRSWTAGRSRTWGSILLVLGGVGKIIAGLSPEDLRPLAHFGGGVLSGPVATVGLLVLARSIAAGYPTLARFWTICGVAGIAGLLLTGAASQGIGIGVGAAERLAAYPTIIATVTAGIVLLIRNGRDRPAG